MMISTHATRTIRPCGRRSMLMRILALIGPAEAAEPLPACLECDDDWIEELPVCAAGSARRRFRFCGVYLYDHRRTRPLRVVRAVEMR